MKYINNRNNIYNTNIGIKKKSKHAKQKKSKCFCGSDLLKTQLDGNNRFVTLCVKSSKPKNKCPNYFHNFNDNNIMANFFQLPKNGIIIGNKQVVAHDDKDKKKNDNDKDDKNDKNDK